MKKNIVFYLTIFLLITEEFTHLHGSETPITLMKKSQKKSLQTSLLLLMGIGVCAVASFGIISTINYLKEKKNKEIECQKYKKTCELNNIIIKTIYKKNKEDSENDILFAKNFIKYSIPIVKKDNNEDNQEKIANKNFNTIKDELKQCILDDDLIISDKVLIIRNKEKAEKFYLTIMNIIQSYKFTINEVFFNPYISDKLEFYKDLLSNYDKFCVKCDENEKLDITSIKEYLEKNYVIKCDKEKEDEIKIDMDFFAYFMGILVYLMRKESAIIKDEEIIINQLTKQYMFGKIINNDCVSSLEILETAIKQLQNDVAVYGFINIFRIKNNSVKPHFNANMLSILQAIRIPFVYEKDRFENSDSALTDIFIDMNIVHQ